MVDSSTSQPDTSASLLAGRYLLGTRRGSAVDAALFDAVDVVDQRPVVVKIVHPELCADPGFRRALDATLASVKAVENPYLAQLLDHGTADWNGHQVVFAVSEPLTGGSLRDLIDRGRLLSPSQALVVGLDACKALDALHRAGLVHGDIRPATIVFGEDRRLRLVDAGLNHLVSEATGGVTALSNDAAKYVSPEEAQGGAAEPRSDVYSLCLTLFEAVTGSVPFVGDSTVATLANRVDRLLPVSADLGALAAVLERAGRPHPADRSTAGEFGKALVQAAPRLPKPEPLPLLVSSLFGPDSTGPMAMPPLDATAAAQSATPGETVAAGETVDEPTADTSTAAAGAAALVATGAAVDAATGPDATALAASAPATDTGAEAAGADLPPTEAVTVEPAHTPLPPPAPHAEPATAAAAATEPTVESTAVIAAVGDDEDDLPPEDRFPDAPPSVRNRWWIVAVLVLLALAGGALAWYNAQPDEVVVPDVVGMEAAAATNTLTDFEVVQEEEASETVAVGIVIRTEPVSGSRVDEGSTVTMYVSTGPAPRVLPELTGLTSDEARAKLEGMGLVVELGDPVFDEAVPLGVVVSWTVPDSPALTAGGTVLKGTTVRLVVSAGPAPRTAPDLSGKTVADATTALAALDLVIAQGPDEYSATVPAGSIIRQDPAPGTAVAKGGTVTVIVSKGPEMVTFPDLTGLDFNGIKAALEGAGWAVGTIYGDPSQPLTKAVVNGQTVTAGFTAPKGTPVDLVFIPEAPAA